MLLFSREVGVPTVFSKTIFLPIFSTIIKKFSFEKKTVELYLTLGSTVRALNKKFRKIDQRTDVLSFPSKRPTLLGSVVIDITTARKQAKIYKHSLVREVQELFVHGVLHLLGFDHHQPKQAKKMKKEEEYFNRFPCGKKNAKKISLEKHRAKLFV